MGSSGFWQELKRRHVYRVAAAYAVVGWLLIQIATQVFPFFKLPDWSVRLIVLAILIGFPIALVLAWAFDVSPTGGFRRINADGELVLHDRRQGMLVVAIVGVLLAALAGAGWWWSQRTPASPVDSVAVDSVAVESARSPDAALRIPGKANPDSASDMAASGPRSTAAPEIVQAAPLRAKSIAVLPFLNESGNKDQQYFSDGLSEALITALSQFAGVKVISRDSSFQFRHSTDSSAEIGRKLGVAHLLEGSVQHAGDKVRISATLVNAADGSTLWSQHYDRPYKDLFALQDAITKAVSGALKAKLMTTSGAVFQSDRPPNGNLAAYAAYLQGMADFLGAGRQGQQDPTADFRKAIGLAPHYALAFARLAEWWVSQYRVHDESNGPREIAHARAAIQAALTMGSDLAAVHVAHGAVLYWMDFDWYGAEAEFRRAVQLAPNDAEAKAHLANTLAALGQIDPAIALAREALELNPRHVGGWLRLGAMLTSMGQLDAAQGAIGKGIALASPHRGFTYVHLATIEVLRRHAQQAIALARKDPDPGWQRVGIALATQVGPDRASADASLRDLIAKDAGTSAYQVAEVYALRRDPDATFKWLDRAWTQRDSGVGTVLSDPFILRYKDDPRFATFCKKVGLPTTTDAKAMP